ncbi:MAG: hypothetical protein BM562_16300 [Alphaproteobacteria bacterium MedPE-SWcel]|nr:MAG: hypothetical protein BM562_16300 [Alphaproteobacteria bacterium MedPE-SWcel]
MARTVLTTLGMLFLLSVGAAALWLWVFGGADQLLHAASEAQRAAQNAMARGLRGLKSGAPGAWWSLMGVCFAYGFFHAAGPGHGKMVIGGYGLGRSVPLWRLSGLAVVSSLAQAATAVLLVLAGVWLFDWGRVRLTETAEHLLAPVSYGLMALLGLYLMLRGLRRGWPLWRRAAVSVLGQGGHGGHGDHGGPAGHAGQMGHAGHTGHTGHYGHAEHSGNAEHNGHGGHGDAADHDHPHVGAVGEVCASCGHRHGPTPQEAEGLSSLREALAIVLAIAARPCTGAVFLLLLTWRLGVLGAGVAGTFVMGLGTASVTLAVALVAAGVRSGLLARGAGPGRPAGTGTGGARLAALLEICAGAMVLIFCLQLLLRSL